MNLFKNLFSYLTIPLAIILCGCEQPETRFVTVAQYEPVLQTETPLGFSWTNPPVTSSQAPDICTRQIEKMEIFLTPNESNIINENCITAQVYTINVESEDIPAPLKNGEISVVLSGRNEPLAYTYHYLHELNPTPETMKKKKRHAEKFKSNLIALYGAPQANGRFDEWSETGFVKSFLGNSPCNVWIEENIGIMLCSERVIYVDGFEMSLAFMRLDNSEFGMKFEKALTGKTQTSHGGDSAKNQSLYMASQTFQKWLDKDRKCRADNLLPFAEARSLSPEDRLKLSEIMETYSGEDLAEYVYENSPSFSEKWPNIDTDKTTLYFLHGAARQGSASAKNEIGASLLYCSQGVAQDRAAARKWLDESLLEGEDFHAHYSKALLELKTNTNIKSARDNALKHLRRCNELSNYECEKELEALIIISSLDSSE